MFGVIKKLLGIGSKSDLSEIIANGAQIIDVRTPGEYSSGHLKGSVNIPLDTLSSRLSKLKKDQAVITCCASGMRSQAAKNILISVGFSHVYNGGSWHNLRKYDK
ncbi:MAG: rhodanese-like domain-containing protein [Bacteroidetes bacterium]|jgi:rhodanese-related sulfurtransferase|nr:rhodanese-like domain-containing protein [Bacteroidota bacterium]